MKSLKQAIRKTYLNYRCWLEDQQWFQLKQRCEKQSWLFYLDQLQDAINSNSPCAMWDAIVDHMHETPWLTNNGPQSWQHLYLLVDEYRTQCGVDSTASLSN